MCYKKLCALALDQVWLRHCLHQKHPVVQTPKSSDLVVCDTLPLLEDVEITASHILFVAHLTAWRESHREILYQCFCMLLVCLLKFTIRKVFAPAPNCGMQMML